MRLTRIVPLILAGLLALPAGSAARGYGDGFGIGGVLLPSGASAVLAKTRIGSAWGLEVALALSTFSDGGDTETALSAGIGVQRFWNVENQLQPYVAGRLSVHHDSDDVGIGHREVERDGTSVGLGGALGAEYFVTRALSLEGEVGLNVHFGSFGMFTGTRLAAYLYL